LTASPQTISRLRIFLLALLIVGMCATLLELVLLEHTESRTQLMPLALLGLGVSCALLVAWRTNRSTLTALRVVMSLCILAGLLGLYLHYRGNVEFELEMSPAMKGWELIKAALMGATPALAPGTMAQLGLLGWAFTYKHPALRSAATPEP
jgi:hypothetical protein